ncbi:hypothetical protein C8039_18935 [Halogeometricum sp. wsp3]|nr:hypothetical protein C8039_18935 [Halogeometricum sp. wsp3]
MRGSDDGTPTSEPKLHQPAPDASGTARAPEPDESNQVRATHRSPRRERLRVRGPVGLPEAPGRRGTGLRPRVNASPATRRLHRSIDPLTNRLDAIRIQGTTGMAVDGSPDDTPFEVTATNRQVATDWSTE